MMKQIKERNLNKNNCTPLHIATENNLIHMEELLLSRGADINAKTIIFQIKQNHF